MENRATLQRKRIDLRKRVAEQRERLGDAARDLRAVCACVDRLSVATRCAARHPLLAVMGTFAFGLVFSRYRRALRWVRYLPLLFTAYHRVRRAIRSSE